MIVAAAVLSAGLVLPFILCNYGTFITERILSNDFAAYNAKWFNYPLDLRKFIILIVAQSQAKINISGFGLIRCNLETFAKVPNNFFPDILLNLNYFTPIFLCIDVQIGRIVLHNI